MAGGPGPVAFLEKEKAPVTRSPFPLIHPTHPHAWNGLGLEHTGKPEPEKHECVCTSERVQVGIGVVGPGNGFE